MSSEAIKTYLPRFPASYLVALQIAAFWQVWMWGFGRYVSSGEEIWGLTALVAAGVFAWLQKDDLSETKSQTGLILSAVFTFAYFISCFYAPPLVRAVFAVIAVGFSVCHWKFNKVFEPGFFGLLWLGLPVMASLNFYLGYPMRVLTGEAVTFLLRFQGMDVQREGVCLHFGEQMIYIDAPCSGVKMLWFGIFLSAVLASFFRFGYLKSSVLFAISFIAILLGNIFRASALFYTESGIVEIPKWAHEAVGVMAFLVTGIAIVSFARFLERYK